MQWPKHILQSVVINSMPYMRKISFWKHPPTQLLVFPPTLLSHPDFGRPDVVVYSHELYIYACTLALLHGVDMAFHLCLHM